MVGGFTCKGGGRRRYTILDGVMVKGSREYDNLGTVRDVRGTGIVIVIRREKKDIKKSCGIPLLLVVHRCCLEGRAFSHGDIGM